MSRISSKPGVRVSGGFTVIELVIAMVIFGIMAGVAVPRMSESTRIARMDRATRAVAIDLEMAFSLASRERSSVRIRQPTGTRRMVVSSVADGTVYSTTDLGGNNRTAVRVGGLTLNPTTVDVSPTGVASSPLTVTVQSGSNQRTVTMSQAGQIRVF